MEKILKTIYTNPQSPAGFSSVRKLYAEARKQIPTLTLDQVKLFLQQQPTYTVYKPVVRKFQRLKTVPTGWHSDWQCDLLILNSIARQNRHFKVLLVCIDVLSRQVFLEPSKSKKSIHMIEAFERIFKRTKALPQRLYSDSGFEFVSKAMLEYFRRKTIQKIQAQTNPKLHGTLVERTNRTIRDRLKRYFYEFKTKKWLEIIGDIEHSLNHSVHSTTKLRPVDVNATNADALWERLYGKEQQQNPATKQKIRFAIGDVVRIERKRLLFGKSQTNFTEKVYIVEKILDHKQPIVYVLKTLDNQILEGYFYKEEICAANIPETAFYVENILQTRIRNKKREFLVKWAGRKETENRWIAQDQLV